MHLEPAAIAMEDGWMDRLASFLEGKKLRETTTIRVKTSEKGSDRS
jgi:hypothetical protein